MGKNAEVDALIGDRPSCQPRKFAERGTLVGTVSTGPREELRIYSLRGKILASFWQPDPFVAGRTVPRPPAEFGFLHISAEVGLALAKILKTI